MAKATKKQAQDRPDLMSLATLVSDRVQIRNIFAASLSARRGPNANTSKDFEFEILVPRFGVGSDQEQNTLQVSLEFALRGKPSKDGENTKNGEGETNDSSLTITATYILSYSISNFEGLEKKNLHAFAQINAVFNAWPFWREFVQNTTSRMGLVPVTIPVYRVQASREGRETSKPQATANKRAIDKK
jgi:hypothetical protein